MREANCEGKRLKALSTIGLRVSILEINNDRLRAAQPI